MIQEEDILTYGLYDKVLDEIKAIKYACDGKYAKQGGTVTLKPLEMKAIRK